MGRTSRAIIECNANTVGLACDTDDTVCTVEVCRMVGQGVACVRSANADDGTPCASDGDACTADTCQGGVCVNNPLPEGVFCDDGIFCTIDERCDAVGACSGGTPNCIDGDSCTVDSCDEVGMVCDNSVDVGASCDDQDLCTTNDECIADGSCEGDTPVDCSDGRSCTVDTCHSQLGCQSVVACDDGNSCTADVCGVDGDCETSPLPDGTVCALVSGCEIGTCVAGACSNTGAVPDGTGCDDSDLCTRLDQCVSGVCIGQVEDCDDNDPCTEDSCDPVQGCVNEEPEICVLGDAGVFPDAGASDGPITREAVLGGGGCDGCSGGTGGTGAMAIFLALAWLCWRRRLGAIVSGLFVVAIALPRGSQAEGLDAQVFLPATSWTSYFSQEATSTVPNLVYDVSVSLDVASDLLVLRDPETGARIMGEESAVVSRRGGLHLAGALGLWDRAEIGVGLPVIVNQAGGGIDGRGVSGQALGDFRVAAKARLATWGPLAVAATATVSLPTGNPDSFSGENNVWVAPRLLVGVDAGRFRVTGNVGYRLRSRTEVEGLVANDELLLGVGASAAVVPDRFWVVGEAFTNRGTDGDGGEMQPAEVLGGFRLRFSDWQLQAGVGAGISHGYGAPAMRGIVGVRYVKMPGPPLDLPLAPVVAEQPEPAPVDSDGDGLSDEVDECPKDPEDIDTFDDEDGCPDPDNDNDRILDVDDSCPLEAEVINGNEDQDGCPDEGLFELVEDRIVLEEKVLFELMRARVRRQGKPVLRAILALWNQHPEWDQMVVEGHSDTTGTRTYNLWLSEKRARRVREAMISMGMPKEKIVAKGLGESTPRSRGQSEISHEKNRRVEFVILDEHREAARFEMDDEALKGELEESDSKPPGPDPTTGEPQSKEAE